MSRAVIAIVLCAAIPSCGETSSDPGPFEVSRLAGGTTTPLELEPGEVCAFVFITHECPIANGYAPELERIRVEFEKKGASFASVHVEKALSDDTARAHAAEYALKGTILMDRDHALVAALGASRTPEAVVVRGTEGGYDIVYQGRIDDLYVDFGQRRNAASTSELRDALTAALAGIEPAVRRSEAVGCPIPAD